MGEFVRLRPGLVVDKEDKSANVLMKIGATGTNILNFNLKPFRRPIIVAYRQSWDAAGNGFITFHLLCNGQQVYQYESSQVSYGSPGTDTFLPVEIEVPQMSNIQLTCDLASGASTTVNFTGQIVVLYVEESSYKSPITIGGTS